MADRSAEQLEAECASLIQEFGFTEYEAYTFVYLLRLGSGTAKDVAALDRVPRTRVYDAVETLHEAGLVDIKYASPQEFTPVSRETAIRSLDLQRQNTIAELSELFAELDPVDDQSEEFGVWTVTGRAAVASRVLEYVDDADDEIVLMTVDELLTDDHLDRLEAAAERGSTSTSGASRRPSRSGFENGFRPYRRSRRSGSGRRLAPGASSSPTSGPRS